MKGLDWPALLQAGLQGLGLTPDAFWQMTPAELQIMLGHSGARAPLLRSGLDALMAAYPDQSKGQSDD